MLDKDQYKIRRQQLLTSTIANQNTNTYTLIVINVLLVMSQHNIYVISIGFITLLYIMFESRGLVNLICTCMTTLDNMYKVKDDRDSYINHYSDYNKTEKLYDMISTWGWYTQVVLTVMNVILYLFK